MPQFKFPRILQSGAIVVSLIELLALGGLAYIWESRVLAQEKGLYSPFQNGLSLIKYLGLIVIVNIIVALLARRRDPLWVTLPLLANLFLLLLSGYYILTILRLD